MRQRLPVFVFRTLSRLVVLLLFIDRGKGELYGTAGPPRETLQQVTAIIESLLNTGGSLVHMRDLQTSSSPMYWVNYTAQFQVIQDPSCTAPTPILHISCAGTGIQVHATSDPSIVCDTTRRIDERGNRYFECTNTCAANGTCTSVYLNVDQAMADGPLGTIDFSCFGPTLDHVRGTLKIVKSTDPAHCTAASSRTVTRVFNVARLGVSCPALNDEGEIAGGSSSASTTRSVIYDDYYFECVPSLNSRPFSDTDNAYTCVDGQNCAGAACTVNLTNLYVDSDVPYFQDTCVQTATPSDPIPAYTIAPVTAADLVADTNYTARFEAAWSLLFEPRVTECQGIVATVAIVCYDSTIRFISSIYDSMNCTAYADNVLACSANAPGVSVNEFVSVTYVSTFGKVYWQYGMAMQGWCTCVSRALANCVDRNALGQSYPKLW
jgi:hypothetical protein